MCEYIDHGKITRPMQPCLECSHDMHVRPIYQKHAQSVINTFLSANDKLSFLLGSFVLSLLFGSNGCKRHPGCLDCLERTLTDDVHRVTWAF